MFTGIVEEIGKIKKLSQNKISLYAKKILNDIKIGDSISVNGVCLTVTDFDNESFSADVSPETFAVTSLKNLTSGSLVNLERAMQLNGRFGGHIVTGHIDSVGKVIRFIKNNDFYDLEIELPPDTAKFVVRKGSVAIDGISLTVAKFTKNIITIAIIPDTYKNTALSTIKTGNYVNIETDIFAKYVEKFLSTRDNRTGIDIEFLQLNGF